MLPFAATALAARQAAAETGGLATFGKVLAKPGGSNAIAAAVRAWLDARAPDERTLERLVRAIATAAGDAAQPHEVEVEVSCESFTPEVSFDAALRDRLADIVGAAAPGAAGPGPAPVLPTGAGHDAGILSARVPAGMLFVRNPTGVSHSPAEFADQADCEAGVTALTAVLADLASR